MNAADPYAFENEPATVTRSTALPALQAEGWTEMLLRSQTGTVKDCLHNGVVALSEATELSARLTLDEFRGAVMVHDMPWRPGDDWREWSSTDDRQLANWLQERHLPLRPTTCADAVAVIADRQRNHPVRNWLGSLAWDGTPRLDTWLADYLGVTPADAFVKEAGRRWLVSGVARIYAPGTKVDHALVLEGPQGAGKSSALRSLVPDPTWFADEISDLGSKDSAQDLRGKWLLELAELSALRRSDLERVKAFMSRAVDHYRPSYGARSMDFPRQCFFAGTTNSDEYLADETGARRFWPVKVGTINLDALKRDRDQLWAEAVAAYRLGEPWWLAPDVERLASRHQAERRVTDPWEEVLAPRLTVAHEVSVAEVLREWIGVPIERQEQRDKNRVAHILRATGFEKKRKRDGNDLAWVYRRVPTSTAAVPGSDGAE